MYEEKGIVYKGSYAGVGMCNGYGRVLLNREREREMVKTELKVLSRGNDRIILRLAICGAQENA